MPCHARTIDFAGFTWNIKNGWTGPGPNFWSESEENVWLDDEERLHLKIRRIANQWACSEVSTIDSLGYGTYRFYLAGEAGAYDPSVVVGLFTYLDDSHEIDIELSRFTDPGAPAGNYTVQPYFIPGNMTSFELGSTGEASTYSFEWRPDSIYFQSLLGHAVNPATPDALIHAWNYTDESIPAAGVEKLYVNFFLFQRTPPTDMSEAELVVTNVTFTPAALAPAPLTRFAVARGQLTAGDLGSLAVSDDDRVEIDAVRDGTGNRYVTTTTFEAVSVVPQLARLDLTIDASASGAAASGSVQLYDYDARRFVTVGSLPAHAADLRHRLEVADPAPYLRDADRHVRVRTITRSNGATHRVHIDQLRVDGAE
jgi:hypothetical protein